MPPAAQQPQGQQPPATQGQQQPAAPPTPPEPSRVAVAGAGVATDGAGIVLALVAYPLLVNLLRGGPSQMWGWVKAKFLNQTSAVGSDAQVNAPPPPKPRPPSSLSPPSNRTAPTPTTTRTVTTT